MYNKHLQCISLDAFILTYPITFEITDRPRRGDSRIARNSSPSVIIMIR